jgi:transposase
MISGIIHVLKSGGRWVDAPSFYGPHKTLYNRYVRWAAKGVWVDLFHALARAGGPSAQVYSSAVKAQSAQLRGSRCVPPGWRMTMRPHFTEASGIIGLIGLRWVASA